MKELNYQVNGRNYLLFEVPVTKATEETVSLIIQKYEGIIQSIDVLEKSTFFTSTKYRMIVLVLENKAKLFSEDVYE